MTSLLERLHEALLSLTCISALSTKCKALHIFQTHFIRKLLVVFGGVEGVDAALESEEALEFSKAEVSLVVVYLKSH